MSLHALKDINNLDDPLKQFLATFVISTTNTPFSTDFAEKLELRAQSFTFPTFTGDVTEVWWSGHNRQYAGKQTRQGDWNVTFTEVWSSKVVDGFKAWMNTYHAYKEGTIKLLQDYATTVDVILFNPDLYTSAEPAGQEKLTLTLFRCWPRQVSVPDINPSSSDPVNIQVQLHYDYFLLGDELKNA